MLFDTECQLSGNRLPSKSELSTAAPMPIGLESAKLQHIRGAYPEQSGSGWMVQG
jgi:hypothetical protein